MSQFHLSFSGHVRKPMVRAMGDKKVLTFGLMEKNYQKDKSAEASWTHVNVTLFDAKPFHIERAALNAYVSGCGPFSMRTWVDKDGGKHQSADVKVDGFSLTGPRQDNEEAGSAPAPAPAAKVTHRNVPADIGGGASDQDPPFFYDLGADAWG